MTPARYRYRARQDANEVCDWYERQSPGLGHEFAKELEATVRRIQQQPEACPIVWQKVRIATTGRFPYVVYFALDEAGILILAVHHGHRKPGRWRSRL